MKRFFGVIVLLFLIFAFPSSVYAVTVFVDNIPVAIDANPFSLTVSVYGANAGKNYLRVDLFREGTINYFGETFNGSEWYFGSTGTSYFPIDITSSEVTVSAVVQAQVGSPSSTDYTGPDDYRLRIRRYTSASSYSASGSYGIVINIPTPSPTPEPTRSPSPTPSPTPAKSPTPLPTKSPAPRPTPIVLGTETSLPSVSPGADVLGLRNTLTTTKPSSVSAEKKNFPFLALGFVGAGVLLMGLSGYMAFRKSKLDLAKPQEYND